MGLRLDSFFRSLGKTGVAAGVLRSTDKLDHHRLRCAPDFRPRAQGQGCPRKCGLAVHSSRMAVSRQQAFQDLGRPHRLDHRNPADDLVEGSLIATRLIS